MLCWTRDQKPQDDGDAWMAQQLRHMRDKLDIKNKLNDDLAMQLRKAERELEDFGDVRSSLASLNSELRITTAAHDVAREEASRLRQFLKVEEEACKAARENAALLLHEGDRCDSAELEHLQTLASALPKGMTVYELREAIDALSALPEDMTVEDLAQAHQDALARIEALRVELEQEREVHNGTVQQLQRSRAQTDETVTELKMISDNLEQREEDFLTIQFEMVAWQNQFRDQVQLVMENADSFQWASEELADKDEKIEEALVQLGEQKSKQDELLAQMNNMSEQLHSKVAELTQEREGGRAACKAVEEQMTTVVSRLEKERDDLAVELEMIRTDSVSKTTRLEKDREALAADLEKARKELTMCTRTMAQMEKDRGTLAAELDRVRAEMQRRLEWEADACERALSEPVKDAMWDSPLRSGPGSPKTPICAKKNQELEQMLHSEEVGLARLRARLADTALSPPLSDRTLGSAAKQNEPEQEPTGKEASAPVQDQQLQEQLDVQAKKLTDLTAALERSRLLERQAWDRAEEYKSALMENGGGPDSFLVAAPRGISREETGMSIAQIIRESSCTERLGNADGESVQLTISSILIAVQLSLPNAGAALLQVAPWQTRSDFHTVVEEFLEEHKLKNIFLESLVKYLEDAEDGASKFPVLLEAELTEVYSRYHEGTTATI
jgi:hypothetical protein